MTTAGHLQLQPPLDDVVAEFEQMLPRDRQREAGEMAYAIAVRMRAEGRVQEASTYGRKCLELFEALPSDTIEQVTSTRMEVAGVPLPELLHDDVVRSRLGHLL